MHPLILIPALLAAPAQAQDVLVPEFTPVIAEDFTLAYMFYSLVVDELRGRQVDFVDGDELRRVAGSEAEGCGDSITCPSGLWSYFPSGRLAVVGTVGLYNAGMDTESIEVRVDFYERDGYQPLKTVERTIIPGQEADFAVALARATDVLVERLAESSAPSVPEPSAQASDDRRSQERRGTRGRGRGGDPEPAPEPEPEPKEELYRSYYDVDDGSDDTRGAKEPRAARQPRERAENKVSPRQPREPREPRESSGDHQLLRAQAVLGLAIGDVARSYDVRLSVMGADDSPLGRYEHDSFTSGVGGTLGAGIMVSPTPWLLAGARLGVVTGRKYLSTGYERWAQGEQSVAELQEYKPAAALRGLIEPRVELAPIAFGPVRPSVQLFLGLRRYDAYTVTDLDQLAYPDRTGGWQVSPGLGLGAVYDLGDGHGVSFEISHAVRLGADGIHHVQQGLVTELPALPDPASHTTVVAVGFTQGFM